MENRINRLNDTYAMHALDQSRQLDYRLNCLDYLRSTNEPEWVKTFIQIAVDTNEGQAMRKYAEHCILQYGTRPLVEVNEALNKARGYMARVNREG